MGGLGKTEVLQLGGNNSVAVQTMWKDGILELLSDKKAFISLIDSIESLQGLGCKLLRFAVPDTESAKALCMIAAETSMPLVADIHFDWRLAIECLKGNVAKIRINPGNIGTIDKVKNVVEACKDKNTAIRIGVNTGSFPKDIQKQVQEGMLTRAEGLSKTAERECLVFEELNFINYVVSMKASNITETVDSNMCFAKAMPFVPLHLGVTEAGPLIGGIVKSTIAFTKLLENGIGATIRVSLSSSADHEVIAGNEILKGLGLQKGRVELVSCPRCGRNGFDVHGFVDRWQTKLLSLHKPITVAVMGCAVNGPGEGKHADLGITGVGNSVIIFKKGKIVRKIKHDDLNILSKNADIAFSEELESL